MNNDISTDFKYIGANKQRRTAPKMSMRNMESVCDDNNVVSSTEDFKNSMTSLGNMGYAQVNMGNTNLNKNTAKSVEQYLKDPDYAELYTEFCDELVKSGYSLEDAVLYTDDIFNELQKEETYI